MNEYLYMNQQIHKHIRKAQPNLQVSVTTVQRNMCNTIRSTESAYTLWCCLLKYVIEKHHEYFA